MNRQELRAVGEFLGDCARRGRPAATATLVRLAGSGYRRPGARMAIAADGWRGFVSGGCVEADLAARAPGVLASGTAELATYDLRGGTEDLWGLAAGCNGRIDVLLEPAPPAEHPGHPLRVLERLASRVPAALVTVYGAQGVDIAVGSRWWLDGRGEFEGPRPPSDWVEEIRSEVLAAEAAGRARSPHLARGGATIGLLVEPLVPTVRVVIAGAGPDAVALTELAAAVGWETVVVDARAALADPARFPAADRVMACEPEAFAEHIALDPRSAAIVMTHRFEDDVRWLRRFLPSFAGYVGLLGPAARRDAALEAVGFGRERLHAPAGLDIGGVAPQEIALAMLSEICAVLAGRGGGPLRDRREPLHSDDGGS